MKTRTFKMLSRIDTLDVKSFATVHPDYVDPTDANALYEGEWMVLDSTGKKVQRASGNSAVSYILFYQAGGMESQVLPGSKVPLVMGPGYLAETVLHTGTINSNDPLTVAMASIDSVNRPVLSAWAASSASGAHTEYLVGYAMYKTGDWLRFRAVQPYVVHYVVP